MARNSESSMSSLDPVDTNYKGCILSTPRDREEFKSEILSKEKLSLNSIPFDEFSIQINDYCSFCEVLCLVTSVGVYVSPCIEVI